MSNEHVAEPFRGIINSFSGTEIGTCDGQRCNRNGCEGVIIIHREEGCSCHINPPCSACTNSVFACPACGWEDEGAHPVLLGEGTTYLTNFGIWKEPVVRHIDPSKIDYIAKSHTGSSMIKEGVYPDWATREQVEEKVKGTFGGRFERFGGGKFKYIAYTD